VRRAAVCAFAVAAFLAGAADAAVVVRSADDAALALAPDGSPRVAYAAGGALFFASPRADGSWASTRLGRLPSGRPRIAGVEVDDRGRAFVLVEDEGGRWLRLADRPRRTWRLRVVERGLPFGAVLGPAGLELDRVGRPAVAYAFRLPDRKTFLRLVTGGTFRTIGITREGFPESGVIPAAAPVRMPDGKLRVLETYEARGGGAILWRHNGEDWRGLFLSSSVGGTSPVGPVFARASGDRFAAAWTLAGPTPGEFQARLAPRPDRPQSNVLHRRALVEALTLPPEGPVLAANEPVGGLVAGLLLDVGGAFELDGRLLGVEAGPDHRRHLLFLNSDGLAWYARPALPALRVSLETAASRVDGVQLSGKVAGAFDGTVTVYREVPGSPRVIAGIAPIAADGSFGLVDLPAVRPVYYRAVYRDPASGIPFASLLRRPVA
jgi:hypothetical protein